GRQIEKRKACGSAVKPGEAFASRHRVTEICYDQVPGQREIAVEKFDWFGPKLYGWGISPRTWQGWLVVALYILSVALIVKSASFSHSAKSVLIIAATLCLVVLAIVTYSADR